ncbi:MAG: hypothetical protein AAGF01_29495 [Cyanobacteria bacterium P01_G01_bin.38]
MSFVILLTTLVVSVVFCSILDNLPDVLLSWIFLPRWLALAVGLGLLAWVTGDG